MIGRIIWLSKLLLSAKGRGKHKDSYHLSNRLKRECRILCSLLFKDAKEKPRQRPQ